MQHGNQTASTEGSAKPDQEDLCAVGVDGVDAPRRICVPKPSLTGFAVQYGGGYEGSFLLAGAVAVFGAVTVLLLLRDLSCTHRIPSGHGIRTQSSQVPAPSRPSFSQRSGSGVVTSTKVM
jgi:hypothetical protein